MAVTGAVHRIAEEAFGPAISQFVWEYNVPVGHHLDDKGRCVEWNLFPLSRPMPTGR